MTDLAWIGAAFGLKAGALIVLGLLLSRALARSQRLGFLRVLLLAVLALPALSALLPPWLLPLLPAADSPVSIVAADAVSAPAPITAGAWPAWPATAYWLTVAFLLARFLRQLQVLRRWARASRPLSEAELGGALPLRSDALARLRIGWCDRVTSPVSFGWPCGNVLLPAAWRGGAGARVRHALAHELAHVERRDWLWLVLIRVTHALAWWNPLLYPLLRALDEETELACDRRALERVTSPAGYARSLLSLARDPTLAAVPMSGGRYWRRRVEQALNDRAEETSMSKIPIACAVLLIGALMLPLAACQLVGAAEPAARAGAEAEPPAEPVAPAMAGAPGGPAAPRPDPVAKMSPIVAPAPPAVAAAGAIPSPETEVGPAVAPRPARAAPPPGPQHAAERAARRAEAAALRRAEAESLRAEAEARRHELASRRAELDRRREEMAAERARRMAEQDERRARLARERAALAGEHAAMARETEAMRAELEAVQRELERTRRALAQAREELERAR